MHAHRRDGRLAQLALTRIERYQHSGFGMAAGCRFRPSCSHYAHEALRTRRLPVAMLLIIWRLLRCNPFMHRRVADPVRRPRRWRFRPNTVPTMLSIFALSGFVVVVTAGVAQAVGVSGGCRVQINRQDPATLTRGNPLVVHKGENVVVVGTIPSTVASPGQEASNTHIDVDIVEGIGGVTSSDHPGHGEFWGGTQNVDNYLKYGVGLYHVTGSATGSSGWTCSGDAYVWLKDGNPLGKPIGGGAAGATLAGLLLAAAATTAPKPDAADASASASGGDDDSRLSSAPGDQDTEDQATDMVRSGDDFYSSMGCLALILIAIGLGFTLYGVGAAAIPGRIGRKTGGRLIWSHGHPIVGFIGGLVMGLGITVLLQQFAVWPLTIVTAIAFPVVIAIICSLRAWLGRSYRVVTRTS